MTPHITVVTKVEKWPVIIAGIINQCVCDVLQERGFCNFMLTGGETVKSFYNYCAENLSLPIGRINFFFGDERCVPPDHPDSNYGSVMKILFAHGISDNYTIERMLADSIDKEAAARAYEKILPNSIDVLLLSMGMDGHIASLFPRSSAFNSDNRNRSVVSVPGPASSHARLTITPRVIKSAKNVFLLVKGKEKGEVLSEAFLEREKFMDLPVRLLMQATWLLDAEAGNVLKEKGFLQ